MSAQAASPLSARLSQYPNWQSKPPVQPSRGDLVYPEWFEGNWTVTTTLLGMAAPLAPDIVTPGYESNRQFLNQPIAFKVRFIEAETKGIDALLSLVLNRGGKQIISDRAFNGMSLAKAYLGDRAILAVKVDPNNPNRQITLLRGESTEALFSERQLISTVIGRAVEAPTDDRFITTEVFQQEFRGTPQLYFNEVENTTAYLHHSADTSADASEDDAIAIEADQVTAIYLSPQDPNYFKTIPNGNFLGEPQPVALYRYKLEFVRDTDQISNF
ncbi:MAG: hypothetical protein KME15_08145 [Drouetiella hepatica Uher 2000/2452]|uniref:DUF6816 domain-containing protein n=1 Tax=Drouetiella hepatica Uher 2000/2452 TaxID=904376 RepID=A0A951QA09_9CYAN|nr:hypothetical protein [Drouetiella hepatica Uher 2000/2452]